VNLTNPERLILVMLAEIYEHLGIKSEVDPAFLKEAISTGNTWGITVKMSGLVAVDGDEFPPEVRQVSEILNLWRFLVRAYESFDAADKKSVLAGAGVHGIEFPGFDRNNESQQLSIARFMVERLDMFTELQVNNSHVPILDRYHRMLKKFEPLYPGEMAKRELNVAEVIDILKA
jgi:uncharacterized protein YfbU (UPF0304 family)